MGIFLAKMIILGVSKMNANTMYLESVDDESFQGVVDYSEHHPNNVVVVDYWAEWCGPCKALSHVINRLAEDYTTRNEPVKFYAANAEESGVSMEKHKIRSVPTLLFMKGGEVTASLVGLHPESAIKNKITELL